MFGQTFEFHDLAVIGLLVILEGVLSIDNALVLGLLAKRLSKDEQKKALTYGLIGAFVFRLIAIGLAAYLLQWRIVKLLGGGYLIYVAVHHFFSSGKSKPDAAGNVIEKAHAKFWPTVVAIELTDIAFAIDSILAAIALVGSAPEGTVGPHPKLWVVVVGGMFGVILMRFAAIIFIKLLEKFPRFETSAYLLVLVIGGKLLADWWYNVPGEPPHADFHSLSSPAFWIFWILMFLCLGFGFIPAKKKPPVHPPAAP